MLISHRLAFIRNQYICQPKFSDSFWSEFLKQILQKSYISSEKDTTYIYSIFLSPLFWMYNNCASR